MANDTRKPAHTIRDGALKATVWKNEGLDGKSFYSVQLSRVYTDKDGKYQDSGRFSGTELLRIARLAGQAYDAIADFRTLDLDEAAEETPDDGRSV